MHIHIDEDYRGARAYGIYRDGERCIVYKNDSKANRNVRYEGTDEAYAVNELYAKIKEMTGAAKSAAQTRQTAPVRSVKATGGRRRKRNVNGAIKAIVTIYIIIIVLSTVGSFFRMVAHNLYRGTYGGGSYYNDYYDSDYYDYGDYDYGDYDYSYDDDDYDWGSSWDYDWDDDWDDDWDWDSDWGWDDDW